MTREINILPSDTLESLEERIHAAEHQLLVDAIRSYLKLN